MYIAHIGINQTEMADNATYVIPKRANSLLRLSFTGVAAVNIHQSLHLDFI